MPNSRVFCVLFTFTAMHYVGPLETFRLIRIINFQVDNFQAVFVTSHVPFSAFVSAFLTDVFLAFPQSLPAPHNNALQ
jgi:hypothetical protein